MKKFSSTLLAFLILLSFSLPSLILAQTQPPSDSTAPGGLIVCNGPDCTFGHLVQLGVRVIDLLIKYATLLTVCVLIYAGIKLLMAGGNAGARSQALGMFRSILFGYMWILVAWILVYTIMNVLVKDGYNSLLGSPR